MTIETRLGSVGTVRVPRCARDEGCAGDSFAVRHMDEKPRVGARHVRVKMVLLSRTVSVTTCPMSSYRFVGLPWKKCTPRLVPFAGTSAGCSPTTSPAVTFTFAKKSGSSPHDSCGGGGAAIASARARVSTLPWRI